MPTTHRALRIIGALLALLVAGVVLAAPGDAAPVQAAPARAAVPGIPGIPDCKSAPAPQRPGTGLPGALDPTPTPLPPAGDPFAPNPTTSIYDQYGYAGLTWHTYDLGCGGSLLDPGAATDTMVGNLLLSGAVWLTAATNGLHNSVAKPATYMAPLDGIVDAVTGRIHDAIWSPWGAVALLGVAALLLYYSLRGHLAAVLSAAAWAVLVLAVVAGVAQYPSRVSSFFDDSITSTIGTIQARSAGINPGAGQDSARAQGALTVDRVLYDAWLRGELGSSNSPAAKRWGPALFQASAASWNQDAAADTPDKVNALNDAKAEQWSKVTDQIANQDPATYAILQGKAGGRAGTGLMALVGAVFVDLFRVVADVFLLAGLVMLRLLVMFFPAAAVVGVLAPLSSIVRRMANIGGAAVVNVVAFSAGSVVHTTAVSAVLAQAKGTGMSIMSLVMCVVLTLAAFVLMYPLLSFSRMLGHASRRRRGVRRLARQVVGYAITREAVDDGTRRAVAKLEDDTPDTEHPRQPRRGPSAPRSETFTRTQPVWDVTSAGAGPPGMPLDPFGQIEPPPASPGSSGARPAPRFPSGGGGASGPPSEPGRQGWVPSREVITGEVLQSRDAPPPALNLVRPHESNAEVRPDGVGYRIYDATTGHTDVRDLSERTEGREAS